MGKEALWVWELTFLNGQNLSRVKGFKPNNPLRGIMDRTQTLVYTYLKNMKVGLKNLYTENIIKYYYKNENNMKSTTLLL